MKYCKITYNGVVIDDILDGYITLNVEGRGFNAPTISTISIDGRDGDYITDYKNSAKNIVVHFLVNAKCNKERLEIIDKLSLYLQSDKDVKFSFGDQEGYWLGRLSAANDINYDYFRGSGTFTLHCSFPYRHMETKNYTGEDFTISADFYKKLDTEKIELNVVSLNEVRINNATNGDVISIKNLQNTGKLILNKKEITLNGKNIINKLDYSVSTWKQFKIKNGDRIIISGATNTKFTVRRLL